MEEIKQAFKDLIKVWQPDHFANDPRLQQKAAKRVDELNDAFQQLSIYTAEKVVSRTEVKPLATSIPQNPLRRSGSPPQRSAAEKQWYYNSAGKDWGPITESILVKKLKEKQLPPDTIVWEASSTGQVRLSASYLKVFQDKAGLIAKDARAESVSPNRKTSVQYKKCPYCAEKIPETAEYCNVCNSSLKAGDTSNYFEKYKPPLVASPPPQAICNRNHIRKVDMGDGLINATGALDRFLFTVGIFLTITFVVLKLLGTVEWEWKWILSPFWICLILTFLRAQLIVKPYTRR